MGRVGCPRPCPCPCPRPRLRPGDALGPQPGCRLNRTPDCASGRVVTFLSRYTFSANEDRADSAGMPLSTHDFFGGAGVLALHFKAARGALMGPSAAWVMFDKGQLFIADRATPIASYSTRGWTYRGVEYPEIECRAFVFVEALGRDAQVGQRIGPRPV